MGRHIQVSPLLPTVILYWSSFVRALFKEFPDLWVTKERRQIIATTVDDAAAAQDNNATTQADIERIVERPVSSIYTLICHICTDIVVHLRRKRDCLKP